MAQLKLFGLGTVVRLEGNEWKMQNRRRFNRTKLFMWLFGSYENEMCPGNSLAVSHH